MPFLQRPGDLALQSAQGNAATVRASGGTPSLTLQFHAGEITHRQMLAAAARSPNFVGRQASPPVRRVVARAALKDFVLVNPMPRLLRVVAPIREKFTIRDVGVPSREIQLFTGDLDGTLIRVTATPPGGV